MKPTNTNTKLSLVKTTVKGLSIHTNVQAGVPTAIARTTYGQTISGTGTSVISTGTSVISH